MAQSVYCQSCGNAIICIVGKEFVFCTSCGNKVFLQPTPQATTSVQNGRTSGEYFPDNAPSTIDLNKKMEEVVFYYSVSLEKGEAIGSADENPVYYLRAQEVLLTLSTQFPNEYRIWWELCKPVDFQCVSIESALNHYQINEMYFEKALLLADITEKRQLIAEHDRYQQQKRDVQPEVNQYEQEKAQREQIQLAKEQEWRRQEEEEQRLQSIRVEEARIQQAELEEQVQNAFIWRTEALIAAFMQKDYSAIEACCFKRTTLAGYTAIGAFKVIANMLYLLSFRIDSNKANGVYQDQSLVIRFDEQGQAIKLNGSPVQIVGVPYEQSVLQLHCNAEGEIYVNDMPLINDSAHLANLVRSAKKPLLALEKSFT